MLVLVLPLALQCWPALTALLCGSCLRASDMAPQDDFGLEDLDELDASSVCRYAAGTVLFTDVVALPELSTSSAVFLQARRAAASLCHLLRQPAHAWCLRAAHATTSLRPHAACVTLLSSYVSTSSETRLGMCSLAWTAMSNRPLAGPLPLRLECNRRAPSSGSVLRTFIHLLEGGLGGHSSGILDDSCSCSSTTKHILPMPAQAAEAGLTMAAVLRHLVSGAAMTAGLPPLPAPEDNGPLPGSVGGIPRPALATLSDAEWAALAGDEAGDEDEDDEGDEDAIAAAGEEDDEGEYEEGGEGGDEDTEEDMVSAVERIPDDMLLSWEDLKDLPVRAPHRF